MKRIINALPKAFPEMEIAAEVSELPWKQNLLIHGGCAACRAGQEAEFCAGVMRIEGAAMRSFCL